MELMTTYRRLSDTDLFWMRPWPTIFKWSKWIGSIAIVCAALARVCR